MEYFCWKLWLVPIPAQIKHNYSVQGFQWVTASPRQAKSAAQCTTFFSACFIICKILLSANEEKKIITRCFCVPPKIMACVYGMIYRNHFFKENIKEFLWEIIIRNHNCRGCIQTSRFCPVTFADSIPLRIQYCYIDTSLNHEKLHKEYREGKNQYVVILSRKYFHKCIKLA